MKEVFLKLPSSLDERKPKFQQKTTRRSSNQSLQTASSPRSTHSKAFKRNQKEHEQILSATESFYVEHTDGIWRVGSRSEKLSFSKTAMKESSFKLVFSVANSDRRKEGKVAFFRVLQRLSLSGTAPKTLAAVKVAAACLFYSTRPEKEGNVSGAERGCLVRRNVIYAVDMIRTKGSRPFVF